MQNKQEKSNTKTQSQRGKKHDKLQPSRDLLPVQDKIDLIPVIDWNKHFNFPTIGALRKLIFKRNENGFDKVLRTLGNNKKLYIKISAFNEWVENYNKLNPALKIRK